MDWANEHYRQRVVFRRWLLRLFFVGLWLGFFGGLFWYLIILLGYK